MGLSVEIVTPRGLALSRGELRKVVLRRREERFDQGSEISVLPRHGEMMVRLPECVIVLVGDTGSTRVHVSGGFAEVRRGAVTVVTPSARVVDSVEVACPDQPSKAR